MNTRDGVLYILPPRHLQTVVDRPADGKQHLVPAEVVVDSAERRRRTGRATAQPVTGVQAIHSIAADGGSAGNSARYARDARRATEAGVGGGDRRGRVGDVQESSITNVVGIHRQQGVGGYIAE